MQIYVNSYKLSTIIRHVPPGAEDLGDAISFIFSATRIMLNGWEVVYDNPDNLSFDEKPLARDIASIPIELIDTIHIDQKEI